MYLESLFSLPLIKEDGRKLPYEEVVALLDTESVDYGVHFGSGLSEQVEVNIKVEKDKYQTAIRWLSDLLYHTELDVNRLKVNAGKLVQNLPSEKREGLGVASAIYRDLTQDSDKSAVSAYNLLTRLQSSPAILQRLKEEPEKAVQDLEALRRECESSEQARAVCKPCQAVRAHTVQRILDGRDAESTYPRCGTSSNKSREDADRCRWRYSLSARPTFNLAAALQEGRGEPVSLL